MPSRSAVKQSSGMRSSQSSSVNDPRERKSFKVISKGITGIEVQEKGYKGTRYLLKPSALKPTARKKYKHKIIYVNGKKYYDI